MTNTTIGSKIWVLVIAPMDQGFVGPFDDKPAAQAWSDGQDKAKGGSFDFDYIVLTDGEMKENVKAYGVLPVQKPW